MVSFEPTIYEEQHTKWLPDFLEPFEVLFFTGFLRNF